MNQTTHFRIYSGNDSTTLFQTLIQNLSVPLPGKTVLSPEKILTHNLGMARWISLNFAKETGLCANIEYFLPNQFISLLFENIFDDFRLGSLFSVGELTWKILFLLEKDEEVKFHKGLRAYLQTKNQSELYRFSKQIAVIFDRYAIYRVDLIVKWINTPDEDLWQCFLFNKLRYKFNYKPYAEWHEKLCQKVKNKVPPSGTFPERISIFGISSLPEFFVKALALLTSQTKVDLYLLNPCQNFWIDLTDSKTLVRREKQGEAFQERHYETGHPILASFGKTVKNFLFCLMQEGLTDDFGVDCFSFPEKPSLFHQIKRDLLEMRLPDSGKITFSSEDESLQIHSCHTRQRELEVLRNYILNVWQGHEELEPSNFLVMSPDIEDYAPLIVSVFDEPINGKKIPYTVLNSFPLKATEIGEYFLKLLRFLSSRFKREELLDLLECGLIREKFDFTEHDVELIRAWTRKINVSWGLDAEHRRSFGVPAENLLTWQDGINRLLMGSVFDESVEITVHGILPYEDIEGKQTETLGRFVDFYEHLKKYSQGLKNVNFLGFNQERCSLEWSKFLCRLTQDFFPLDLSLFSHKSLVSILEDLENRSIKEEEFFLQPDVIEQYVSDSLEENTFSIPPLFSGIIFSDLQTLSGIPASVIALIGITEDSFPRKESSVSFDVMRHTPRNGDPSHKERDRSFLLEAILVAKESLFISYIGQDMFKNQEKSFALPVFELLEYIDEYYSFEDEKSGVSLSADEVLIYRHALYPFHPQYFENNRRYFTYSSKNRTSAEALLNKKKNEPRFFSSSLVEKSSTQKISLSDLQKFFSHPSRFLLREVLKIRLEEPEEEFLQSSGDEPFLLEPFDAFYLGNEWLKESKVQPQKLPDHRARKLLESRVPLGYAGEIEQEKIAAEHRAFMKFQASFYRPEQSRSLFIEHQCRETTIFGEWGGINQGRFIQAKNKNIYAKDIFSFWLCHLLLQGDSRITQKQSLLLGKDPIKKIFTAFSLLPMPNTEDYLQDILSCYQQGLTTPLPYWPEISCNLSKGKKIDLDKEWRAAYEQDLYLQKCFVASYVPGEDFKEVAQKIFGPVMDCLQAASLE